MLGTRMDSRLRGNDGSFACRNSGRTHLLRALASDHHSDRLEKNDDVEK